MIKTVIKRNGEKVPFDKNKIRRAIVSAWIQIEMPNYKAVSKVTNDVISELINECYSVADIENLVMSQLYKECPKVAMEYSSYRRKKEYANKNPTDTEKVLFVKPEVALENGNKDASLTHIKNAYLAEIPSRNLMRKLLPKDCLEAHDKGIVYFHDMAYSARNMHNCELLNLDELFKGCRINGVWIDTPKSFRTACTVATQILTHATSIGYGGITINLLSLAKFVDVSRQKIKTRVRKYGLPYSKAEEIIKDELSKEIKDGLQTFLYQNNTLCAGTGQAVFLSVSIWLNEDKRYKSDYKLVVKEFLKQRIDGMPDEKGIKENPNFPKILYFLDDDSFTVDMDTTKLAAECSAKRLTPDYMSVKKHIELKGVPIPSMGCRSWLSPWKNEKDEYITFGRFNCGVQSLNLPYIVMENNPNHDEDTAIKNLYHYLDIANRDALWRLNHCAKIKAGESPLLWIYGGLLKLKPEETIEKYIYNGYSTVSIGYAGLYEAVYYITGEDQWGKKGNKFAHKLFDIMNKNNDEMKKKTGAGFALYGSPMETTTEKFADACIRDFGHVGDGTQRRYITNSYHYPVFKEVDAFTKLKNEGEFSDLSLGGSISYCEIPNLANNIDAVLNIMKFIKDSCNYAELNSEISECASCGFSGYDFKKIYADDGTLRWQCPNCGESDPKKVKTSYRICGYISNYTPNAGRSQDIMNRVKHLNIEERQ